MPLSLWITLGVAIFFAAVTAGLFANNRSPKTLLGGLGLTLLPLGLYFFGLTDLLVNGIQSIIDWAQRTVFDTTMTIGAVMLGVAVLLLIVAGFIKPQQRKAPQPQPQATGGASPRAVSGTRPAAQPQQTTAKNPASGKADKGEDDEIEAILRRRGIM